jgi:hypothetical protein
LTAVTTALGAGTEDRPSAVRLMQATVCELRATSVAPRWYVRRVVGQEQLAAAPLPIQIPGEVDVADDVRVREEHPCR